MYPDINMWEVARPVVESYIKKSIGPRALARDLASTLRVLSRFGPRLPQIAENALAYQAEHAGVSMAQKPRPNRLVWFAAGAAAAGIVVWALSLI
jgi:ubiquinone biosynthesis protein